MDKLTVKQVADKFNVFPQAVYKWHDKGWLVAKFAKDGSRFYKATDVEKFYEIHRVGKVCKECKKEKSSTEFKIPKSIVEYGIRCWECEDRRQRAWQKSSKDSVSVSRKKIRNANIAKHRKTYVERNQTFICQYLNEHACLDCGEADIIVLEFDHKENKIKNVATMVLQGSSIEAIKKEINKCDVVCANCHRKRTAKRGNHYRYKYDCANVLL